MPHSPRRPTGRALLHAALAFVGTLAFLAGPTGVAAQADDDDYVSSSPSTCRVDLVVGRDGRLMAVVEAHAPGNVGLRGTVRVRITRDGRTIASQTHLYRGKRLQVLGPRLGERASYGATMRFTPSGAAFQSPCAASTRTRYAVLAGSGSTGSDGSTGSEGSTDPGDGSVLGESGSTSGSGAGTPEAAQGGSSLLPGTGGPALWTLAIGLGLLGAGALVLRRRRTLA